MWAIKQPRLKKFPITKEVNTEWRSIHSLADGMRPEMVAAFLLAIANTKDELVLARVERAMDVGDLNAAVEAVPWDTMAAELGAVGVVFSDIYNRAGQNGIKFLPRDIRLEASFNTVNPASLEYIAEHTGALITEVTTESREAVRQIIRRAFEDGMHPYKSARYVREVVGLTTRQALAVDNFRRLMVGQGLKDAQITRQTERYGNRLLKYRSENIARTETLAAANRGTHSLWLQAADQGLINRNTVRRVWITTPDDRLCDFCLPMDGQTVGLEEDFRSGVVQLARLPGTRSFGATLTPPLHPMCRCTTALEP